MTIHVSSTYHRAKVPRFHFSHKGLANIKYNICLIKIFLKKFKIKKFNICLIKKCEH